MGACLKATPDIATPTSICSGRYHSIAQDNVFLPKARRHQMVQVSVLLKWRAGYTHALRIAEIVDLTEVTEQHWNGQLSPCNSLSMPKYISNSVGRVDVQTRYGTLADPMGCWLLGLSSIPLPALFAEGEQSGPSDQHYR